MDERNGHSHRNLYDIEELLNGNQTAVDVYMQEQKLLHDTYLDAAKAAKEAALYNDTTIEDTQAILQTAYK